MPSFSITFSGLCGQWEKVPEQHVREDQSNCHGQYDQERRNAFAAMLVIRFTDACCPIETNSIRPLAVWKR
jgi:hypothetical protein